MKTFKRKSPKAPSKFAQFIRFCMLGMCIGVGLMILKVATFSQLSTALFTNFEQVGWLTAALIQLCDWSDKIVLAPAAAYFAGRIFMSNKWKFVFAMFVGIELFPVAIVFADGAGISTLQVGFALASIVFGLALSLFTFGRGVRAACAEEQLPPGASPVAPQPLPQPLSQIDFNAVSKELQSQVQAQAPSSEAAPVAAEQVIEQAPAEATASVAADAADAPAVEPEPEVATRSDDKAS